MNASGSHPLRVPALEVFGAFLKLGCTSFGGPVAHLGFFHQEFVLRRRWLDEEEYADLLALCQFLPGPASSQVGFALGLRAAGVPGAFAAWAGFTLPSALLMILFAYGIGLVASPDQGWMSGLKIAAVAVVAKAVWDMAVKLCPDRFRVGVAGAAAVFVLLSGSVFAPVATIVLGALATLVLAPGLAGPANGLRPATPRWPVLAKTCLGAFLLGLLLLPVIAASAEDSRWPALADSFYRTGSLVFGGGHVVLPLLESEVVARGGWVSQDVFLAGYGAAQALPGPLFAFSAYLGTSALPAGPGAWLGGVLCLVAVFLPSWLLVLGVIPVWQRLRAVPGVRAAMAGANAAVVGLLLATLYHPVWTGAIRHPADFSLGLLAFLALKFWNAPPWAVVIACAGAGWLIASAAIFPGA